MPPKPNAIATVFLGFLLLTFCHADPGSKCSKKSPLVNLELEFKMHQHQLRGSIKIPDNCSFKVSNFDMLSGSDVQWWGAATSDFNNLTAGFVVSDHKLNETYKKASFTVRLRDDVTWDQIQVLAV